MSERLLLLFSFTDFEEVASIFVPSSALGNTSNSIYSFFYVKPNFFTTNETLFIKDSKQSQYKTGVAVSSILSASVMNQAIENLTNPISIKFKKINPNKLKGSFDCYFWSTRFGKFHSFANLDSKTVGGSKYDERKEQLMM